MAASRRVTPLAVQHGAKRNKSFLVAGAGRLFFKKERLAFLIILFIVTVLRLPTFSRSVLDWDESLYILMAGQWLSGHLPYTTIWDNKPVGIYAIFAIFEAIFRAPVLAMRAATVLAVCLTAFGLWRLAPVALADTPPPLRRRLAALAAAAFILGSLSNDGLSANTEIFMEGFSLYAMLAALATGWRGVTWRGFVVGLLFGMACMTKYVAIFEAPAIAFALLFYQNEKLSWPRVSKTILGAVIGAALIPALTVLTYAVTGHLGLWWQCSIIANAVRVSAPISPAQLHQAAFVILPRWLPFVLAAVILFAAAPRALQPSTDPAKSRCQKFHVLLMLWLAGGALGVASAKSFYDHYFLQILPPLCLAFVWLLARPACRLAGLPRGAFAALAAILLAIPAFAGEAALAALDGPDTPSRIAAALRPAIAAGATLYVFDGQPIIYALTGAAPPTRYVFPSVLTKCPLEKVAGIDAAREVAAILSQNPSFILRNPYPPSAGADLAVYGEVTKTLTARYKIFEQYPDAVVYQRQPGAPENAVQPVPDSCNLRTSQTSPR